VVGEARLKALGTRSPLGLFGPDVFQVTFLGAVNKKKRKNPELFYALTSHRPDAKIFNLLQWSGGILNESRNIYFDKILCLLRCFDPAKTEISYCDTGNEFFTLTHTRATNTHICPDSCILAISDLDFCQLLKPEHAHRHDEIMAFLMENPIAKKEQSSFFKFESSPFEVGYFKAGKAYAVQNPINPDHPDLVRVRSIARKYANKLEAHHFWQDPRTNTVTVRGLEMQPTLAMEIQMVHQSKTLSHALNLRRRVLVSSSSSSSSNRGSRLTHFFLILAGSLPLALSLLTPARTHARTHTPPGKHAQASTR
jgi:hypothetical protein